jgi:pectate lyase
MTQETATLAVTVALLAAGGFCAAGTVPAAVPAFPGAEGWGSETPGGRGGKVFIVTNLRPDGPGSLQEACAAEGPRIVAFAVSGVVPGTITIEHSNITLAGQTATDAQKVFSIEAVRREPNEYHHALVLNGVTRLVLDHVTASWGADAVVSLCRSKHVTVQWCTLEEGATKEGRKYSGIHNFGLFSAYNVEGDLISVHHNLFAHNSRRNPSVRDGFADIRNNVTYNFRGGIDHDGSCASTGVSHDYNCVGNVFKTGPNSRGVLPGVSWGNNKLWWAVFRNETRPDRGKSKSFVEDNLLDGQAPPLPPYIEDSTCRLKEAMRAPKVATHKATEAYERVLAVAGAFPRDAVTRRTIEEVRTGTGDWGRREPEGGLMAGLTPAPPPLDADQDGMPDDWEKARGLDPDRDDSAKVMDGGYTAVEVYLDAQAHALITDHESRMDPP